MNNKDLENFAPVESKKKPEAKAETKAKKPSKIVAFLKSRNAKRGSVAVALTILFVAVVVGLNIIATMLTNRFPVLSTDLTSNNVYELTEPSVDFVSKLEKDVNVHVLMEEKSLEAQGEYYIQVNKLLKAFEQQSKHIKVDYVNLATNPTFTTDYPDVNWQNSAYLMLVEHGDDYIAVSFDDVFTYDQEYLSTYGEYYVNGQKLEQALLTAVLNVTTEEKVTVTFIDGLGGLEVDAFTTLLSNNAYNVEKVSLLNGEISKDSQFVVLFAPTNDLDKDGYNTLSNWLYNDGNYGRTLLYVPNDTVLDPMPNIDTLLEEWGMSIDKSWIYETNTQYMTNSLYPNLISIFNYDETEFSGGLKDTSIPVVLMYCMPVSLDTTQPTALLSSSDVAVRMPLDADENWDYNEEEPEKLIGAAISTAGNEDETKSSNVVVFGSYAAFSQSALSTTSFNNSAYILNLFNTIADREDASITVEGKTLDSAELGITSTFTSTILAVIFRYLVPLAVVTVGIVKWLRRRHR